MQYKRESLGNSVIPSRYELFFEPDMEKFTYSAKSIIHIDIKEKTKSINLNSAGLEISKASINSNGKLQNASINLNSARELLTLSFPKPVSGKASIEILFSGKCTDSMNGLYRSKYTINGKTQWMLTTQFEAANARNAFPCFDEPGLKAVYDLSLLVDNNLQCISNMPIKNESKTGSKKLVVFDTTLKMSTYLLYIGVGNFDVITDHLGRLQINAVTVPGKKDLASLALSYAKKFIRFYETYFGIQYPLPKIDLIAVPDFAAGAMENWGAITFRETALLAEGNASIFTKQRIAETVAHELTHQWFGDLVTMKWWDDLWLNESFATFMSYKAMDAVFPEWNISTEYLNSVISQAFAADQLLSTHPIHVNVSNPGEIDQIFDEISYQKGGSVLNMLEDYVGKDVFRKGLHIYLKNKSYSNAEADDLWDALGKASKKGHGSDIKSVANSWISKKGYPYINVKKSSGGVTLKQERFTLLNSKERSGIWPVPIHYSASPKDKSGKKILMSSATISLPVKELSIKLNLNQKGFFRTLYSKEKLDELGNMIKENELTNVDAWGIENDLYAFTKRCDYTLEEYLDFIGSYCFAAKYPLNLSVIQHIGGLYNLTYNSKSPVRDRIKKLLKDYSTETLKQVGWIRSQNESTVTTKLRSAAISASGFSGDTATIHKAGKLFEMLIESKKPIDPNLRSSVYGIVAFNGNKSIHKAFTDMYIKEEIPDEKSRYLQALGMFNDISLLKESLRFTLSDSVKYGDSITIPAVISSRPAGRSVIWQWTRDNWTLLRSRYQSGTHLLQYFVDNLAAVPDEKTLNNINSFFSKKQNMRDDIRQSLEQANEIARINLRFMRENGV